VTDNDAVRNAAQFLADVRARMLLAPVCLSGELALPHARTDAVSRMVVGIGRTTGPLAFDAEHRELRFIILIGTPKAAVTEYLQAVAALSRFFRNPTSRERLLAATDEAEFRAVFAGSPAALR
jgi:mannitol/fructose-specific phosphotransferase system IIA component (Ntr-type)